MDRKVYLLGELGNRFGKEWQMSVSSVKEAIKLIDCQVEGFRSFLLNALDNNIEAAVIIGDTLLEKEEEIFLNISEGDIYISLLPCGSKKGWGKILAAIAIAVVSFYTFGAGSTAFGIAEMSGGAAAGVTYSGAAIASALYSVAINLALAGVSELLTKPPSLQEAEDDNKLFDGPVSTVKQGVPIPLLYGRLLISGTPMSVSFDVGKLGPGRGIVPDWSQFTNVYSITKYQAYKSVGYIELY